MTAPVTVANLPAALRVGVIVGAGATADRLGPVVERLACRIVGCAARSPAEVTVDDPAAGLARIRETVDAAPLASSYAALLRQSAALDVPAGLAAESATYSMLLAGAEFLPGETRACAGLSHRRTGRSCTLTRDGDPLLVELDRPQRRNVFDRVMRDAVIGAFDSAVAEPRITEVELHGRGPVFCSGGDLDEFGSASDPVTAHIIRLERNVGAESTPAPTASPPTCMEPVGAGIELPAFGGRVLAARHTAIALPELRMGLIPCAGGTVSGHWRTAYLGLSAAPVDAATGHGWSLVDHLHD